MSEQDQKKNFTPKGSKQEEYFLEGPHSRASEFNFIIKVMREFLKGFRALHFVGPCVTVFGSARFKEDHPYYQLARVSKFPVVDIVIKVIVENIVVYRLLISRRRVYLIIFFRNTGR